MTETLRPRVAPWRAATCKRYGHVMSGTTERGSIERDSVVHGDEDVRQHMRCTIRVATYTEQLRSQLVRQEKLRRQNLLKSLYLPRYLPKYLPVYLPVVRICQFCHAY